jgi:hypothetical protein
MDNTAYYSMLFTIKRIRTEELLFFVLQIVFGESVKVGDEIHKVDACCWGPAK